MAHVSHRGDSTVCDQVISHDVHDTGHYIGAKMWGFGARIIALSQVPNLCLSQEHVLFSVLFAISPRRECQWRDRIYN